MNVRKLVFALALATMVTCLFGSISFAKSKKVTKDKNSTVSTETSGEVIDGSASGEQGNPLAEQEEISGDKEVAKAEEEAKTTSGDEETPVVEEAKESVSGDEEVAKTEEEAKTTSGDEETPVAEEVKESVSGDEKEAESGEKVIANDVPQDAWYAKYVEKVLDEELMEVDEENNFYPTKTASRKDALDSISNIYGGTYTIDTPNEEEFLATDVTREEVAYLVYLYAQSIDMGFQGSWMFLLEYNDRDQIDEDAYEAVAWCTVNEIIVGRPGNIVAPKDPATRAELATIVSRFVDKIEN